MAETVWGWLMAFLIGAKSHKALWRGFSSVQRTPQRRHNRISCAVMRAITWPTSSFATPVVLAVEKAVHGIPKCTAHSCPDLIQQRSWQRTPGLRMSMWGPSRISMAGRQ